MDLKPSVTLPAAAKVFFLSDTHLGDGSAGDLFGRRDAFLVEALARAAEWADVVVLGGDIFDHAQARTHEAILRAHRPALRALAELAARRPVCFIPGNHERLPSVQRRFPQFRFAEVVAVGSDLCCAHGHQFDWHWSHGLRARRGFTLHTWLERHARRPIRQPFRDFDNWVNRVAHRLFYLWTRTLKVRAELLRRMGQPEPYATWEEIDNFWARGQWGDLGAIFERARAMLLAPTCPWRVLVLGHAHWPGVVQLTRNQTYVNAGSWTFDDATCVRIHHGRAEVFDAVTGAELSDERYRVLLDHQTLPTMADWFHRYYRGFFRYDVQAIQRDFPLV